MEHESAGMVGVKSAFRSARAFFVRRLKHSKFESATNRQGSIEFWTKSKKMTTKWNQEAGTNWMS